MTTADGHSFMAFEASRCIAAGPLEEVAQAARHALDEDPHAQLLILSDETGRVVDLDLRGSAGEVRQRYAATPTGTPTDKATKRGRPSLGVVAREVTLLPRHWEWLAGQPGGASVTLRKLVEEARRGGVHTDRVRQAKEAAYRMLSALAGDLPHYEEALRALFAGDGDRFAAATGGWPGDIGSHARRLAGDAFG